MSILYEFDPDQARPDLPIPSPCVGVCHMDLKKNWCEGCYRSIEEITRWSTASGEYKLAVWHQIRERML